jgi:hypothetical protein
VSKGDRALLSYNENGALSNCLAIEDHLASLPPGVNNSWCAKKHAMLCVNHHLSEAVNHASRIDPQLGARYRKIRDLAAEVLKPDVRAPLPALGDVASFRNTMRRAFNDPTLTESCAVCKSDGGLGFLDDAFGMNWLGWAIGAGVVLWFLIPRDT